MPAFTPVDQMINYQPVDLVGIAQMQRKNALADRDQSLQEQNSLAQRNHLATMDAGAQQEQQFNAQTNQRKLSQDDAAYLANIGTALESKLGTPEFSQLQQQAINDPRVRQLGVGPEHFTPQAIASFSAMKGAQAGQAPPTRYKSIPGKDGSLVQQEIGADGTPGKMSPVLQPRAFLAPNYVQPGTQIQPGRMPPGYRLAADGSGNMEAVPGGPADYKRAQQATQAQQTVSSTTDALDRLASEANAIRNDPALTHITGLAGKFPNMPGGPGANVQARLETLKSQVGFTVLQAMRDASKTGGALGSVSDYEGKQLQNNLAGLDTAQSTPAFQAALDRIIAYTDRAKGRIGNAYQRMYGEGGAATAEAPPIGDSRSRGTIQRPAAGGWTVKQVGQ